MYTLPSRLSDAGPETSGAETHACAWCLRESSDATPCQGDPTEACRERICCACRELKAMARETKCSRCGLHACGSHMHVDPEDTDLRLCSTCVAEILAEESRVPEPDGLDDNRPLACFGGDE